jgi:hypothetical protein
VDLEYPRNEGAIQYINVGLMDVRAADDIRISYDFERDGYKIEQAQKFEWQVGEEIDYQWKEAAFIRAWQFEKESE